MTTTATNSGYPIGGGYRNVRPSEGPAYTATFDRLYTAFERHVESHRPATVALTDLPNLELVAKDAAGELIFMRFVIRKTEHYRHPSFRFTENMMDLAKATAEEHGLYLPGGIFKDGMKNNRARIKDFFSTFFMGPWRKAYSMDTFLSNRIFTMQTEHLNVHAYRPEERIPQTQQDLRLDGVCGYVRVGDTVGYFTMRCPLMSLRNETGDGYILEDAAGVVQLMAAEALKHWPFLEQMGFEMRLSSSMHDTLGQLHSAAQWMKSIMLEGK